MNNHETPAETLYETFTKRQAATIVAANDASQPRKHSGTERHNDDRPTSARCSVTMVIIGSAQLPHIRAEPHLCHTAHVCDTVSQAQ